MGRIGDSLARPIPGGGATGGGRVEGTTPGGKTSSGLPDIVTTRASHGQISWLIYPISSFDVVYKQSTRGERERESVPGPGFSLLSSPLLSSPDDPPPHPLAWCHRPFPHSSSFPPPALDAFPHLRLALHHHRDGPSLCLHHSVVRLPFLAHPCQYQHQHQYQY